MLLSEGRCSTQISSAPSEHTDTSGIVLLPTMPNQTLASGNPTLESAAFPTMTHHGGSFPRPRMWQPWLLIMVSSTVEGNDGQSAASGAVCHVLQLSPALALLSVMLWCHTWNCIVEVRRIAAKKVLGLEKSLALLLVATHTSLAAQDMQYLEEHNSLQIIHPFSHSSCKRRLEKDRIIKT